jgi:hypothetical protein
LLTKAGEVAKFGDWKFEPEVSPGIVPQDAYKVSYYKIGSLVYTIAHNAALQVPQLKMQEGGSVIFFARRLPLDSAHNYHLDSYKYLGFICTPSEIYRIQRAPELPVVNSQ